MYLLNFWDTNGNERSSKGLPNNLYKNCAGIILVCSYDKRESFESLPKWLDFISLHIPNKQIPILLMVNKNDIAKDKKLINSNEITEFSENNRIPAVSISARKCESAEVGINKFLELLSGDLLNLFFETENKRRQSICDAKKLKVVVELPKKKCC